jgi:hypothetical protein
VRSGGGGGGEGGGAHARGRACDSRACRVPGVSHCTQPRPPPRCPPSHQRPAHLRQVQHVLRGVNVDERLHASPAAHQALRDQLACMCARAAVTGVRALHACAAWSPLLGADRRTALPRSPAPPSTTAVGNVATQSSSRSSSRSVREARGAARGAHAMQVARARRAQRQRQTAAH